MGGKQAWQWLGWVNVEQKAVREEVFGLGRVL